MEHYQIPTIIEAFLRGDQLLLEYVCDEQVMCVCVCVFFVFFPIIVYVLDLVTLSSTKKRSSRKWNAISHRGVPTSS